MSTTNKWLDWTPDKPQIIQDSPRREPTKPSKPSFVGFEGSVIGETQIIRGPEAAPGGAKGCPFALPEGVRLIRFERKKAPVAVTVCSVVADVPKFIQHALGELDARLHNPIQIKAGDSVFELLSKLADCGLELRLEWPPEPIIQTSPIGEPSKPAKPPEAPEANPPGVDITDEDIPF